MKATVAAIISAAVIAPAVGQTSTPGVDKSVKQEVKATQPAPKATAKLETGQTKLTAKERAKLAKAKKKQSRNAPKAS